MRFIIPVFCFVLLLFYSPANAQVKIYEGTETISTYQLGPDEVSPMFYTGRGVQGAAGHIYPYPAQTRLGEALVPLEYKMVYLENEYLKVTVLPEFGGRLFSAIDKTNGHELFHTNSVIKPDLIGTLGAWISGGIEWCFPHHHRTSTLLPADYRLVENEDGSATIWVGETEKDLRLRGVIGITLRPGRSYIEVDYRLNNTNAISRNFLFWANVAVTADENFRTFWPPSQEIGVFHSNTSFTHWPISQQNYRGIDYTDGVDLTWWKNHPDPVSFFFWQGKEGFVGGYDYAQKAGTVHVGDVHENKTSKLWQFGPGLQGQNARRKLTDDGKAYVELMTGTFSNNQPGYSWFAPHGVKDAKNYWYPLRDIEIAKNATVDASVTLQMRDDKTVFYGFNTTKEFKGVKAILKYKEEMIDSQVFDIDPGTPFTTTFTSQAELDEYQLYLELQDAEGQVLVSYQPYQRERPELPAPQEKPKFPHEIETVEDLYLTGRFVEQFSRPNLDPDDYYLEALERSPNDYRVNLAMGMRRVQQWRYEEALSYLKTAADKLKVQYFQPKEGELFYYLGLAHKGAGNREAAYKNFFQSTWYYQWFSPAYYQLALMESQDGNYTKALEFVANAYSTNNYDGSTIILYSALLRQQGETEKALEVLSDLLDYDPLNFAALYEKALIEADGDIQKWQGNMQAVDNNYLEIAVHYLNAGLYNDGISLLEQVKQAQNPLVPYYQALFYAKAKQNATSANALEMAQKLPLDYCFPYRQETEQVLKFTIANGKDNSRAYYLLGNLLYDRRPDEAIAAWELAIQEQADFPLVMRNLAFGAFYHENDIDKAIAYMHKAIEGDNEHPVWYAELEKYYDVSEKDNEACLALMEKNILEVKKDVTAPKSLVKLYNLNQEYDKALDLLKIHHFRTWEGGREIYYHYVDALTLKALQLADEKKYKKAIRLLEEAMLYPENLEVGKPLNDERNAMIHYFMGSIYKKAGNQQKARDCFEKSVIAENARSFPDLVYFQALSYEELGEPDEARALYQDLIAQGEMILEKGSGQRGIGVEEASNKNNKSISNAYYFQALGTEGLGEETKMKQHLDASLHSYKNNLWAKYYKSQW